MENAFIFDSHAHYDDEKFNGTREQILDNIENENVGGIINCAIDIESCITSIELSQKYSFIYAAVGFHPESVTGDTVFNVSCLDDFLNNPKVVAIGEIGIDYYWDKTFKDKQIEIFESQIKYASLHNLPIIVHDREAHNDTFELLKKYMPKGVVHCFSGSTELAKEIIKLGMYIGVGGVVTFKNSKKLQEVVKSVPLERILLETDAPYLAPEPYRGKINNSAYIKYIAEKIAELKETDYDTVLSVTYENSKNLFNIK